MKRQTMGILAAAAMTGVTATAGAAIPAAGSCRGITTELFSDGAMPLRAARADAGLEDRPNVIRASFNPPAAGREVRVYEPAEAYPEPGRWTTLLAGLLGVVTIARRRMP